MSSFAPSIHSLLYMYIYNHVEIFVGANIGRVSEGSGEVAIEFFIEGFIAIPVNLTIILERPSEASPPGTYVHVCCGSLVVVLVLLVAALFLLVAWLSGVLCSFFLLFCLLFCLFL